MELNKSQKEIKNAAREFAKGEFDKNIAADSDKRGEFPFAILKKAAELGFIGIHYDEAFGGGGMGMFENVLIAEEFCRKDSGIGAALMLSAYGTECLLRFGAEEMKKRFLPQIAEGKILSCAAFYEPGAETDLFSIKTSAEKSGEEWKINGSKAYAINGSKAGLYIVLCRTSSDPANENSLSMFLTEAATPGLTIESMGEKLGMRMCGISTLHFADVRVPASNLIGKEGAGLSQVRRFFEDSMVIGAAMSLGMAQGAFERALDYVKQREQFDRKIVQFEATRHKLADMAMKIELSRLITYQAAYFCDQGKPDAKLSCMAKTYSSQAAVEVCDEAVQLLGGYGYMTEYEVERFYRDAKILDISEIRKDVRKNMIADAVIGQIRK